MIFHEFVFPYIHDLVHPKSNGIFPLPIPLSSNNPILLMFIYDTYPKNSNSHDLSLPGLSFTHVSFQPQFVPQHEPQPIIADPTILDPNFFAMLNQLPPAI